ncbi:MAG: hypothetical protein WBF86_03580 [Mycobacterium sp.]|jgi:Ca2+:H+ antiporter
MTAAAPLLTRRDRTMIAITVLAAVGAGALHFAHANSVVSFIVAALALATLASLVGRSVKALGDRILQSPVQIALTVAPIVCLSAAFLGQPGFDLVLSPLLLAVMVMSALVAVLVTFDGESNWFEGAALIALYIAIATAFWWG